eukprot:comp22266_c0_seq1/m.53037 comp22266_c0_seq1/g.53037  ORF comp22266_c0_seq1/g.53037 comp22266_c0_seq1/m.53037 type:complete len:440 (+) comp22266_c0_seq1:4544-5863(+)
MCPHHPSLCPRHSCAFRDLDSLRHPACGATGKRVEQPSSSFSAQPQQHVWSRKDSARYPSESPSTAAAHTHTSATSPSSAPSPPPRRSALQRVAPSSASRARATSIQVPISAAWSAAPLLRQSTSAQLWSTAHCRRASDRQKSSSPSTETTMAPASTTFTTSRSRSHLTLQTTAKQQEEPPSPSSAQTSSQDTRSRAALAQPASDRARHSAPPLQHVSLQAAPNPSNPSQSHTTDSTMSHSAHSTTPCAASGTTPASTLSLAPRARQARSPTSQASHHAFSATEHSTATPLLQRHASLAQKTQKSHSMSATPSRHARASPGSSRETQPPQSTARTQRRSLPSLQRTSHRVSCASSARTAQHAMVSRPHRSQTRVSGCPATPHSPLCDATSPMPAPAGPLTLVKRATMVSSVHLVCLDTIRSTADVSHVHQQHPIASPSL